MNTGEEASETVRLLAARQRQTKTTGNVALVLAVVMAVVAIGAAVVAALALDGAVRTRNTLEDVNTSLQGIRDQQSKLTLEFNKLRADVGGETTTQILKDIQSLEGKVGSLQTTFTTLQGQADGTATALATLQGSMTGLQSSLDDQASKVATLTGDVTAASSKITNAIADAKTAQDALAAATKTGAATKTSLDDAIKAADSTTTALTAATKTAQELDTKLQSDVIDRLKVVRIDFMNPPVNGQYQPSGMSLTTWPGELQIVGDIPGKGDRVVGFYKVQQRGDDGKVLFNPGQWFVGLPENAGFERVVKQNCQPNTFC